MPRSDQFVARSDEAHIIECSCAYLVVNLHIVRQNVLRMGPDVLNDDSAKR